MVDDQTRRLIVYPIEVPFELRDLVAGLAVANDGSIHVQYTRPMIMQQMSIGDEDFLSFPVAWSEGVRLSLQMRPASVDVPPERLAALADKIRAHAEGEGE